MDLSSLAQIPKEYQDIYKNYWNTIRTSVKLGRLKDVYHFAVTQSWREISKRAEELTEKFVGLCKMNVAFGVILRHRTTRELKYCDSANNRLLFQHPRLLATSSDRNKFIADIASTDFPEYASLQGPSTKWIFADITSVRFDVYKLL